MKKNLQKILLVTIAAGLVLPLGCGQPDGNGQSETEIQTETGIQTEIQAKTEAVTFTDDLGREVTVESAERTAALIGSFADIWLLSGGELVAAANDSWESLGLNLGEDVANLGSILEPDIEKLIAAQPDLVLASVNTDADVEMEELLTQAGITVAYFDVSDFEDYLRMLDICTQITGRRDLYETNGTAVQEQIAKTLERVDGSAPTVLFLRASSSSVKAKGSDGNVCGEMLADLGCVNIADQDAGLLDDLSMEAIIAADPEYIFVTTQGNDTEAAMQNVEDMLVSNPAWSALSAIQNDRYYLLEKRLFNLKPNARWAEAYEQLADILYPAE
ncbi:MAG: ABC transporter substrate-binding protein [Roseburia sp.]